MSRTRIHFGIDIDNTIAKTDAVMRQVIAAVTGAGYSSNTTTS